MSSKHRHGLPRKRPARTKKEAIDAQLKAAEPAVAPVDDGPVSIRCEAGSEDGVDTLLTVDVPEMEKKAVFAAVEGPLRRAADDHAASMRWQRVVVNFAGDALIGSAIKDLVREALVAKSPVRITVRRGYGDEVVHEVEPPSLDVSSSIDGGTIVVAIGTGELEAGDLAALLQPVLVDLAGKAAGARFALTFDGAAKPDSGLRDHIATTLRDAGAVRVAVGTRVLFDRELTDRCLVAEHGDDVVVTIDPAADPAITGEAMETVLPDHALGFAGKAVRVEWKAAPQHGEGDHLVRIVASFAPEHIEFVHGSGEPEVVWPAVIELVAGSETTLRVRPHGRSHTTVLEALPAECADLEGELRGKAVIVDWPRLFVIDEDTERCLAESMAAAGPKSVCCTVAGEDREPFFPPPVTLSDEEERCIVAIDTDAGRPVELVRAIERLVPRHAARLSGKVARVVIGGQAPASRTLLRSLLDLVVGAGPTRLELEDHGPVDVLLPPMLGITRSGSRDVRIEVDLGGRDAAQQQLALKRELDEGALPKQAVVTLAASPIEQELLPALIAHGADSVTRDDGTQLHPEALPEPEPAHEPEVAIAARPRAQSPAQSPAQSAVPPLPAPAAAVVTSEGFVRVIARNDEAVPPTVLLGVDAGDGAAHLAAIEQQLAPNLPRFQRRAVMVVVQQDGHDVPVRKPDPMVDLLRRVLPTGAAATLIFRGPDAQGRPHFQVLHSTLRAMPVGANFRDPHAGV